jgi:hypothetical protein
MGNPSGPRSTLTANYAAPTVKSCASVSTSVVAQPVQAPRNTPKTMRTSAPSAEKNPITLSPGPAARNIEVFLDVSLPPRLSYSSFTQIHPRPSFDLRHHNHPLLFKKIVTPYDPDAFEHFLDKHNITSYPDLTHNLRHGFPLGDMPNLTKTNIIPNHPSIFMHSKAIDEYISEEVVVDRMSGPFSADQVEAIL